MNGYAHHVDSLDENCWTDLIDYSSLLDDAVTPPPGLYWNPLPPAQKSPKKITKTNIFSSGTSRSQSTQQNNGACVATDVSFSGTTSQVSDSAEERECRRKRGRNDQYGGTGNKACREKMRREKLNDRFAELSATLEPGRPAKTDKLAILGDAIRVLNQLKTESEEYKEMNEKLLEEIKTLKADKNELRVEKLVLKTDKERMEQQLKSMAVPPTGFMPAHPPVYPAAPNKMPMFPGYSLIPMWQYLPPSVRDTTQDHELRPPAA